MKILTSSCKTKRTFEFSTNCNWVLILNHKITINSPSGDTFTSNFCLFHKFFPILSSKVCFPAWGVYNHNNKLHLFRADFYITYTTVFWVVIYLWIRKFCRLKHILEKAIFNSCLPGKISAQPHTIVKQICFPNGNVLFLYPRTECMT